MKLKINRAKEIFNGIKGQKIAVIGDVMLDKYFWGTVSRVSPEAPVPVVDIDNESCHLGGAANVAQNLQSLGMQPILFGLLGSDNSANIFIEQCNKNKISTDGLYQDINRATTVKTRVIGNNQQIVRMDIEHRDNISLAGEEFIIQKLADIVDLKGIIFEDYDKGTINKDLIDKIVKFANSIKIPIFTDPKFENFNNYKGVNLFKPNRKETEQGLSIKLNSREQIEFAGKKILELLSAENILITLGAEGMVLFEKSGDISSIPTFARKVADVSGAGDTAIATLAAMIIAGATYKEAAIIANFASGVVCEKPGIVAIKTDEIIESIQRNNDIFLKIKN